MLDAERLLSTRWLYLFLWLSAQVTRGFGSVCSEFFYLGGDYGAHEGRFESPGYPLSAYPRNTRCTWIIKVPQNHRVRLYFTDFDIESCHNANYNCSCDAVEVYNGELLISQRLAQFCGNELPPVVLSGGRYMRVDLVSDEDTGKKGFAAGFYSVSSDPVTPTTLDRNGGKFLKTKPTTRGAPSGSSSPVMIAIVCSLVGILIISSLVLFFYIRHQKQNRRKTRTEGTEMATPMPRSYRGNEPEDPPPPYEYVT